MPFLRMLSLRQPAPLFVLLLLSLLPATSAQNAQRPAAPPPTAQPQATQAAELGKPTFVVSEIRPDADLHLIAYGDMRFTDPANISDTNPRVRKWLVDRVAHEKPDALLLSGDLPFYGSNPDDWKIYREETAPWMQAGLRVYTTLGNHEQYSSSEKGLANYFDNFPELKGNRWYSVQFGSVYIIALDSIISLDTGSPQRDWLEAQFDHLPPQVNFVFVLSHMPMMADVQSEILVHLPAPEQISIRDFLESKARTAHAKFIVVNGHIHNYERFDHGGICYLVSGGGGAKPYPILVRGDQDLYRVEGFPNFHYLVINIHGKQAHVTMYRVADPKADTLSVEPKDTFTLEAR